MPAASDATAAAMAEGRNLSKEARAGDTAPAVAAAKPQSQSEVTSEILKECLQYVEVPKLDVDFVRVSADEAWLALRAVLSLPDGVNSAADLDVEISRLRIVVRMAAGGLPLADADFPCAADPDSAQVVFSRKRRTLTVQLQPADPKAAQAAHDAL